MTRERLPNGLIRPDMGRRDLIEKRIESTQRKKVELPLPVDEEDLDFLS